MSMMLRRRLLSLTNNIKWDFSWDYTVGDPRQNGFTPVTQGTYDVLQLSNGYELIANMNSYVFLSLPDYVDNNVVLETTCFIFPTGQGQNTRISISNGTNGVGIYVYRNQWRIMDSTLNNDGTIIKGFTETNKLINIQLAMKNGVGSISIDGVTYVADFDITRSYYTSKTMVGQQNGGNCIIQSVSVRKN